jgi:hypothetical protein
LEVAARRKQIDNLDYLELGRPESHVLARLGPAGRIQNRAGVIAGLDHE